MKIHLPWQHESPKAPVEPGRPHAFVEINDPGIGAMAAATSARQGATGVNPGVIVTDNYLRKSRCGVPGCGRDRHDEMHAIPED